MGILKNVKFTGTINGLIFYERFGELYVRSAPAQVRQSAGSKAAAKNFGWAYSRARLLRSLLASLIPNPKDRDMQNRLARALKKLLSNPPAPGTRLSDAEVGSLQGFRFNPAASLKECLQFPPEFTEVPDGKIRLEIPALNPAEAITAPEGAAMLQIRAMAASFSFEHDSSAASSIASLNILLTDDLQTAQSLLLEVLPEKAGITVLALALSWFNQEGHELSPAERFRVAEIVRVWEKR